jgi:hypothetical protein
MEQYILCALLHAGMQKICWPVQTTTQCTAERDDWMRRAEVWRLRSAVLGTVWCACWRASDERAPAPRRALFLESSR